MKRTTLIWLAALGMLTTVSVDGALAQKLNTRGPGPAPMRGGGGDGGYRGGGGLGGVIPGVLLAIPQMVPAEGGQIVDNDPQGPRRQNSARRGPSGAPP